MLKHLTFQTLQIYLSRILSVRSDLPETTLLWPPLATEGLRKIKMAAFPPTTSPFNDYLRGHLPQEKEETGTAFAMFLKNQRGAPTIQGLRGSSGYTCNNYGAPWEREKVELLSSNLEAEPSVFATNRDSWCGLYYVAPRPFPCASRELGRKMSLNGRYDGVSTAGSPSPFPFVATTPSAISDIATGEFQDYIPEELPDPRRQSLLCQGITLKSTLTDVGKA